MTTAVKAMRNKYLRSFNGSIATCQISAQREEWAL